MIDRTFVIYIKIMGVPVLSKYVEMDEITESSRMILGKSIKSIPFLMKENLIK